MGDKRSADKGQGKYLRKEVERGEETQEDEVEVKVIDLHQHSGRQRD